MAAPVLQFKRGLSTNVGLASFKAGEPGFTTDKYDFYIGLDATAANQKFFGSSRYWTRETGSTSARVKLVDKDGTNFIGIAASDTLSGIATYRLPNTTNGSTGDFLKLKSASGGYYDLEWAAVPSGSFSITGDTGTDTFTTGEILTFAGTSGEIKTTVTNNQVQIGLQNNVTIGNNLYVTGITTLAGNVTLGDNTSDDITVGGEFVSSLNPNTTNVYDLGTSSQRWRNLWLSGNLTVAGVITATSYNDIFIADKDLILANTSNPTDTTANHGGIAIASTEGSPLVPFNVSGVNTLPDTYKQLMWFKSGTLGFSTDAFGFNYGVAIGTTSMANGVRLAVGTGVTISDTGVSATNFYGALTGNASSATYAVSAGIATYATTAGIATRAQTVDTTTTSTNADYYVPFVSNLTGTNGETVRVGAGLSINPSTGNVGVASILSVGSVSAVNSYIKAGGGSNAMYLYSNGDVSFQAKVITNSIRSSGDSNNALSLSGRDVTFGNNINVTGVTTTATFKLSGTSGIGITGISASTTLAENSDAYLPTQKAVKAYVDAVDLTTGIAGDSGTGTVNTSQTLTIAGTANQVTTAASGQTITVSLPSTVIVGTAVSAPSLQTATLKHQNGTTAATIDTSGNLTAAQDLTISGNLYVNGSTTQVNTSQMTVEDRTIELGIVDGSAPSSTTTWDLGVLFNYYDGSAKKSALIWEQGDARFKLGSVVSDGGGTGTSNPQITFTTYAALELGELWINNTCTGGSSQVIACSGSNLILQNITLDAGTF